VKLHKLKALVPLTDELWRTSRDDAVAPRSKVPEKFTSAREHGDRERRGVGRPQGMLNSRVEGHPGREVGQGAGTITTRTS
jgi:hypothetical protein